jgi:phenylalanyl-tRNA synthetase beta chain
MPTVAVDKEELWERLGHSYCTLICNLSPQTMGNDRCVASEDFDNLLFEFGLELDEDVRGSLEQGFNAWSHTRP